MTKIDRYILILFLRTVLVCFCSIAGIFIVFHAFTSLDDLVHQARTDGGLVRVMIRFYGPYMLLLFDWTGAIIVLMSLLFTVGWLRRTGEMTATLSAGISHGRILRPMLVASFLIIAVQLVNREFLLPHYRDALAMKAKAMEQEPEQPILPCYDLTNQILIEGASLLAKSKRINYPSFRLDGDFAGYGDLITARTAQWTEATADHAEGYWVRGIKRPEQIDSLPSVGTQNRPVILTRHDHPWLQPNECFIATTIHSEFLQTDQSTSRMVSISELASRIKNPAVHSSMSVQVLLHERMVRPTLDYALVLLGLPIVVNRRGRNLFLMIAVAIGTVMFFFGIKTLSGAMGGSGYLLSPAMSAWVPLLILGPIAYVRLREVQNE
ncbi:putative permease YjgP/YjgQ family protein [Novipirellula galeiformis]|uniref:Putative permease YjgP/YjgQ family protein n=1 Tax=Novipirellula galeiformis TaxID=2528004 RepID=A0A5C6CVT2_9BACT|nr:LptF/LptG family permease [Novipirellula galeiformis]TWU26829.1 putative permease YjgP/YjgQ family protein [Novipirellula galeiformis]